MLDAEFVATADDFGGVKVFNFPCIVEDAPFVRHKGHSSHVSGVAFLNEDRRLVSTGSNDRACIVFKFANKALEARKKKEDKQAGFSGDDSDGEESLIPPSQLSLIQNFEKTKEVEAAANLRRTLTDPFAALRGSKSGVGSAVGTSLAPQLKEEMDILALFLGELLTGVGGQEAVEMMRRSGALEKNKEEVSQPTMVDRKVKLEEAEKRGLDFCVGAGYDVSDEELKRLGMYEIEQQARKEKVKARKKAMK